MKIFDQVTLEKMDEIVDYLLPNLTLGNIVFLEGPLGAGKTTLVQMIAKKLNIKANIVSPTFTIAKPYNFQQGEFIHIDAYRLSKNEDDQQWIEMCDASTLCLIEWPSHLRSSKNLNAISIVIKITSPSTRRFEIKALQDV
jgi:tRNA threonylcarbamoyladenosine biosynthesis protein TsaE